MPIRDIDSLRQHLQWAIEIEHSTFPPYLCTLFSIKDGHNEDAAAILHSIFLEEMLHMTLAVNMLNAIGGSPQLDKPDFIASYPSYLPHSNLAFQVPLAKFSQPTIETIMRIERPEGEGAPPEDDRYETIGQFYEAIEEGLMSLSRELGQEKLFCGDPAKQVRRENFRYSGGGNIIAVTDLGSALEALEEIVEQGEGMDHDTIWDGDQCMFHPDSNEVAHYFRLNQIICGRHYQPEDTAESGPTGEAFTVDWDAVYDMRPNPKSSDYPPGSSVHLANSRFNLAYSTLLGILQQAFNGKPEMLDDSVGTMMELKKLADDLMKLPSGDGKTCAGPSFEYIPPEQRKPVAAPQAVISIATNGPYRVLGGIPLVRKEIVYSEVGESLTWRKKETIPTQNSYALCRCGGSSNKPFCDGTHLRIGFDGTETADAKPTSERQHIIKGPHVEGAEVRVKTDATLCAHARFCVNRFNSINKLMHSADDVRVRSQAMAIVEKCPSGTLTYEVKVWDETTGEQYYPVEPDLPKAIGVVRNGPLWVTGGILIERADGQPVEARNRVTLCRCGHSKNKPFCDGTHNDINFSD
jgi:CDGSH-type Zn-finger protein